MRLLIVPFELRTPRAVFGRKSAHVHELTLQQVASWRASERKSSSSYVSLIVSQACVALLFACPQLPRAWSMYVVEKMLTEAALWNSVNSSAALFH